MRELVTREDHQPAAAAEARMLGRELAAARRSRVEHYRRKQGLSPEDADAKASEPCPFTEQSRAMDCPPEEVSWHDLEGLADTDPELALTRWEEVKAAAREELRTGDRAAKAMAGYAGTAWDTARFIALRDELADGWQPRNGIERQLIDMMAQAQTQYLFWLDRLALRGSVEPLREERDMMERGGWRPASVSDHQAIEQAAGMVDRFNRMFVRCVRNLRDLRRHCPSVVVQNAGQVNVGGQQVNVNGAGG